MRISFSRQTLLLGAAFTLTACITVNIYFPAPEVRRAAEEIVEETWGDGVAAKSGTPGADTDSTSEPISHLPGTGAVPSLLASVAYAKDPDINVSTAAIRALKESIRKRSGELKPFLGSGSVGIGHDGMLVALNLDGVPLRDQATLRRLVSAENRDRKNLYREIATANDLGGDRIPDIQRIFADTWIDKAEPGWPIQKPDGSWTKR